MSGEEFQIDGINGPLRRWQGRFARRLQTGENIDEQKATGEAARAVVEKTGQKRRDAHEEGGARKKRARPYARIAEAKRRQRRAIYDGDTIVALRMNEDLLARVEAAAKKANLSRSEWIRTVIYGAIFR